MRPSARSFLPRRRRATLQRAVVELSSSAADQLLVCGEVRFDKPSDLER